MMEKRFINSGVSDAKDGKGDNTLHEDEKEVKNVANEH
jgi:hypothetical protein